MKFRIYGQVVTWLLGIFPLAHQLSSLKDLSLFWKVILKELAFLIVKLLKEMIMFKQEQLVHQY